MKGIIAQSNKENEILKYENDISCVNHHEKINAQIKSQNRVINCPLLNPNLKEDECLILRQEMNNFFTDKQVLQRLKSCDSYFDAIDTVAFHKVRKYITNTYCAYLIKDFILFLLRLQKMKNPCHLHFQLSYTQI